MTIFRGIINSFSKKTRVVLGYPPEVATGPRLDPVIGHMREYGHVLIIRLTPKMDIYLWVTR